MSRFFRHRSVLVLFAIWISLPLPMWHVWMHDASHSHESGHVHGIVSHALGAAETTTPRENATAASAHHRRCGSTPVVSKSNSCPAASALPTVGPLDCALDPTDDVACLYCELGQSFAQLAVRAERLVRTADDPLFVALVVLEPVVRTAPSPRASRAPPFVSLCS